MCFRLYRVKNCLEKQGNIHKNQIFFMVSELKAYIKLILSDKLNRLFFILVKEIKVLRRFGPTSMYVRCQQTGLPPLHKYLSKIRLRWSVWLYASLVK